MGHTVSRHERQALKMDNVAWGGVSGDVRRELRCERGSFLTAPLQKRISAHIGNVTGCTVTKRLSYTSSEVTKRP